MTVDRLADRFDDPTVGRVMQGVAAVGVLVAALGGIVGWSLVGHLDSAAGDTLALTEEALVTIDETVAVADDVVASTVVALEAVELTLGELVTTSEAAQPLLASLARLGDDVAPNLESATDTLRALADVGALIDRVLRTVGTLPGAPTYDPSVPLAEQFDRLADDIAPVAESLREVADELAPTVERTAELQERAVELQEAVRGVREDLVRSEALLSDYAATASGAREVTERTRADLSGDVTLARVLVVAAALVFAAGQVVPYWYGRELLARGRPVDDLISRPWRR